jgi:hypothetical protein
MPVKVERFEGSFDITYYATGAEEDVERWCADLIRDFDPKGYGTSCEFAGRNKDKSVTYKAHRFLFCD